MGYLATKRTLAAELTNHLDPDAPCSKPAAHRCLPPASRS